MRIQLEPTTSDFKGIIDYHYKKIDNGKAQLLESPLIDTPNKKELTTLFQDISSQNNQVKYPCQHISINLQHGENLSNQKYISLAHDYLRSMKWDNSPFAIIRHKDKKHSHIHIVLSTVDYEGNKIDMYKSHTRTTLLSAELEKKYNLRPVPKISHSRIKLSELNQHKHLVGNLIKKISAQPETKHLLSKYYQEEELNDIRNNQYNNQEIATKYPQQYEYNFIVFEKLQLLEPLLKEQLCAKIEKNYLKSNSITEYHRRLKNDDIYIKHITKKGQSYYVYGDKTMKFFIKDTSMEEKYRLETIQNKMPFRTTADDRYLLESTQKHIIYNSIRIGLQTTGNYKELKETLSKQNIQVEEHRNSGGIYGISFSIKESHCNAPRTFKASEINRQFSYSKILNHYSKKQEIPEIPSQELALLEAENRYYMQDEYMPLIPGGSVSYNKDDDYENNANKDKKKRKKGRENRPLI